MNYQHLKQRSSSWIFQVQRCKVIVFWIDLQEISILLKCHTSPAWHLSLTKKFIMTYCFAYFSWVFKDYLFWEEPNVVITLVVPVPLQQEHKHFFWDMFAIFFSRTSYKREFLLQDSTFFLQRIIVHFQHLILFDWYLYTCMYIIVKYPLFDFVL